MRVGRERNYRAKRNGTAPPVARVAELLVNLNANIRGETKRLRRGTAILIFNAGILCLSDRTRTARAISGLPIWWAMDGNGRAHLSSLSPASSHFRSIPDIPRTSLTENISS